MSVKFDARIAEWREQIDTCLQKIINDSTYPNDFKKILEYAVFPGGKRLRPILFLEWHGLYAPPDENALKYACGLELMHCFSLIHDDMPCADNDDMRRGKPTVHKQFGEGKALLAGDALMDMAYNCMYDASNAVGNLKPSAYFGLAGDRGIIHGQYLDLYGKTERLEQLLEVYKYKTGALIRTACVAGYIFLQNVGAEEYLAAILGDYASDNRIYDKESVSRISGANTFGEAFGVAFQLYDDISEYVAGEKSDAPTVLDFLRLDQAKSLLNDYLNIAITQLNKNYNGDVSFLRELVEKFVIV